MPIICTAAPDFRVVHHGSIVLVKPQNAAAKEWLHDACPPDEEHLYWCGGLSVEPRYLDGLLAGIEAAGLTVQ